MPSNVNKYLHRAKKRKNDEFYTQLEDIEKELSIYTKHFKDKVVYCNCDDPYDSNFFKYFVQNFRELGLKRVVATCVSRNVVQGFQSNLFEKKEAGKEEYRPALKAAAECVSKGGFVLVTVESMRGDGDFRSEECEEILKESDVIVTNPPFSLYIDWFKQVMRHKKKFLVISSLTSVAYKDIINHIVDGSVILGWTSRGGGLLFNTPNNGLQRIGGTRWYTNIQHGWLPKKLELVKEYTPEEFPMYDNYNMIEVGSKNDIPKDYYGIMAVPVTYIDSHRTDMFDLLGGSGEINPTIDGRLPFRRLFIRRVGSPSNKLESVSQDVSKPLFEDKEC